MNRRDFVKATALSAASPVARSAFASPLSGCTPAAPPFGPPPAQRLDQGPFTIDQDAGWQTVLFTTPSEKPIPNPGLGLVGYTWEENGPSVAAREGRESLEQSIEKMASLPFVDVLYIRCDWRNVQKQAGRLDLDPVWPLTFDAAKRHGLRIAFRIQLSNPEFEPERVALPDFVRARVPLAPIGKKKRHGGMVEFSEPRYDAPAFQQAFSELNTLLAERFDRDPLMEWVDLMMYGFWGEGHTSDLPNPFPDPLTARRTFERMTAQQLEAWKQVPIAVNTQPDISAVGNAEVLDLCLRAGAWMRTDSIHDEEPIQMDQFSNRPAWIAGILEDGDLRRYDLAEVSEGPGVNAMENRMLHVLDIRGNYWALWTEADNLRRYFERYPRGFERLQTSLGYRLRPAWVWQRKRFDTFELIVGVANRGVAGVPGTLWLTLESADGKVRLRGALDSGQPQAGGLRQASFLLPGGYSGPVRLAAELEVRPGNVRRVRWACEQPLEADGSITIDVKAAGDPGWRKGI
ncbi:MAG: hypothetical protein JO061_04995 [Acidobacteriaceae bacterium]|nr:hypothetical protein [Acidobacteriaceae bacterium]